MSIGFKTTNPKSMTVTVNEAAAMMGLDRKTVYRMIRAGTFPTPVLPYGNRPILRIPRILLERHLTDQSGAQK